MRLRRLLAGALALTAVSAALAAPPASASADAGPAPVIDPAAVAEVGAGKKARVIVTVRDGRTVSPTAGSAEAFSAGTDVLSVAEGGGFFVMEADQATLAGLGRDGRVASVRADRLLAPAALPSSTKVIGADRAHAAGVTGRGQNIVIMDTGIDRDHPAFAGRIVAEACFSQGDQRWSTRSLCPGGADRQTGAGSADAETELCLSGQRNLCAHGSLVAGIAAGKGVGGHAAGVAPEAGIIAIQVFTRFESEEHCGKGKAPCVLSWASDQLWALDYVIKLAGTHRIAAVNASIDQYGYSEYDEEETCLVDPVSEEIGTLSRLGIPTILAAGNTGSEGQIAVPACVPAAVTVGATDDSDAMAPFSNRGTMLDLLAPGVGVTAAAPDDSWAAQSGTSLAAAHVTGAFALLKERTPEATGAVLLKRLQDTGKKIAYRSRGQEVSTARIDLARALALPDPTATPTPTTASPKPTPVPTTSPTAGPAPSPTAARPSSGPVDSASGDPAPAACERGRGRRALSAAGWAKEISRNAGTLKDATLLCYLNLAQEGSKVFPEKVRIGSLDAAYRVLTPKSKAARALLDRELLAAWLNHAHGAYDGSTKVKGATTLKGAVTAAERHRLSTEATSAQLRRAAAYLNKNVNRAE
ncbi:S8 family serine peptidase [Planomonospora sp. ID91781]|uniref:S8 family peptidase n=1 Tax=Planomonospora sp. ID91781 TaxID=2738135 RepID=UPI0018C42B33|nr:S8 family serine peptidase [Planomonospora sp. ID91781]MBG0825438.1 S8 family serine peptidase [Planomonospora sp. ID91781]